jgi:putative membrane protein
MERTLLRNFGAALAAGVFLSAGAFAQQPDKMSPADTKFAREAAMGGMEEVQLGKVAVQNASSDQVKQFGQRMIDDHTKAGDELKGIASKKNITLPTELDAKHKAEVNKYSSMKGADFDRAYMKDMVKDHETDVAEFQKEASGGSDKDIQGFASRTLPTLQDHLRMARDTAKAVGAVTMK